jgi:DNA helicase-2/ATP-dependent DNA helicase PcrA
MADNSTANPAVVAAEASLKEIYECLDAGSSFLVEAGAGAGKTHSLVMALQRLIETKGAEFVRKNQQVACITFTNVASEEIKSRTDGHPAIFSATIHAFCWLLIKDLQPFLKAELSNIPDWTERLAEAGGIGGREIEYELGFPSAKSDRKTVTLAHSDVLAFTVKLMAQEKFRRLILSRYPVIFIDEYQDTDEQFVESLKAHCLGQQGSPVIGFFGDHWQQIYGETSCGNIAHDALTVVEQKANFRSDRNIVEVLNKMRPELPQAFKDPKSTGVATAFHTNEWKGVRRDGKGGGHWTGDLPATDAHSYLDALKAKLASEGWDFSTEKTKILMLTHGVLAAEQGYSGIHKSFSGTAANYAKKEDQLIKFLLEIVEPVCRAYAAKHYGEMFAAMGGKTPSIRSHGEKEKWTQDMSSLLDLRAKTSIGEVIDHLKKTRRPRLPEAIEKKEQELIDVATNGGEESSSLKRYRALRGIKYEEIVALSQFVDDHTPFSTKHGVKGAQFENVLVVAGRGWSKYNFNRLLEWLQNPANIGTDGETFERNRNLFYVACSRPKKRLAILFTQELSATALECLNRLFGQENVQPFVV